MPIEEQADLVDKLKAKWDSVNARQALTNLACLPLVLNPVVHSCNFFACFFCCPETFYVTK